MRKLLAYTGAALTGPAFILLTLPLHDWTIIGGAITAIIGSGEAVRRTHRKLKAS